MNSVKRFLQRGWSYIVLGVFCALIMLPFAFMFITSLRPMRDITKNGTLSFPSVWTLDNYTAAWERGRFPIFYKNSIAITVATVAILSILVILAAYALSILRIRFRKQLLAVFLLGMVIPFEQIMMPLFTNMRDYGLINNHWGVIFPQIALSIPVGIVLVKNYMQDIPYDIVDAARIDGAPELRVLWSIVLPMTMPVINTLLIYFTLSSWNNFMLPNIVLQKTDMQTLTVGLNYFKGSNTADFPLVIAAAFIVALPVIVIYFVFQRKITDGMLAGSVKG